MEKIIKAVKAFAQWFISNALWVVFTIAISISAALIEPWRELIMQQLNVNAVIAAITIFFAVLGIALVLYLVVRLVMKRVRHVSSEDEHVIENNQNETVENPIGLEPYNKVMTNNENRWVSVKVYNNSNTDHVENCKLKLIKSTSTRSHQSSDFEFDLSWSAITHQGGIGDGNQPRRIRANDSAICDVAQYVSDTQTAYFTTTFGALTDITKIQPGQYQVVIRVSADWQNRPIISTFLVELSFENNILKIGNIEGQ